MIIKDIFKYRSMWMALAIILVVLYHRGFDLINFPILNQIQSLGYCGVDIFIFSSGLGLLLLI